MTKTKKGKKRDKRTERIKDDLNLGVNAVSILTRRYLIRNINDEVSETQSQLFHRVARTLAKAEKNYGASQDEIKKWADRFYQMMARLEFLPNTPCLINAGARLGQLSACFVIDVKDSLESIFYALSATAKVHQGGGGTGFSFSKIRPKGNRVDSTGGKASGPISFMKIFDQVTETIRQGGVRRGANMGVLRVDHPDILEFIALKDDMNAMKNFNLSVAVTDRFMKAVGQNKFCNLINPKTGKPAGKLNARDVFDRITSYAWKTGDPGIIFIDEINRKNPTRHIGKIESTNPCGEAPLHPWESCNLGSINLAQFVDGEPTKGQINWNKLKRVVIDGVRFLDNMIDASRFPLKRIENATLANRRIGLGVMGFAEMLIRLGIPYNSNRALETAEKLAKFIEEESIKMSAKLGRMRGSFLNFRGSFWQKSGHKTMRNATTTVIAPTGSISIIAGCSSGIEPLFAVSYVRNVMEGERLIESNQLFEEIAKVNGFHSTAILMAIARTGSVQGMESIHKSLQRLFLTALEIPYAWHVKMQAAFQKHTHSAVSKTINFSKNATIKDVRSAYLLAWKLKCKGITVYRYGSKPQQVLSIGSLEPAKKPKYVTVDSEFAGGCPGVVCSETTI